MTPQEIWDHYRKDPLQDMYDYSPYLKFIAKGTILEIGVREGVSTAAFLLGVETAGGHVFSVDVNPACKEIYDHPQWTFIHAHSVIDANEIGETVEGCVDILLIDGDHSYDTVMSDLNNFTPLVKPGGLILMHDIDPCAEVTPKIINQGWFPILDPRRAFSEFLAAHPTWNASIRRGRLGLGVIEKGAA